MLGWHCTISVYSYLQHVFANIELIRGRCRCSVVDVEMEEHLQAASARLHGMMDSVADSHSARSLDSASEGRRF